MVAQYEKVSDVSDLSQCGKTQVTILIPGTCLDNEYSPGPIATCYLWIYLDTSVYIGIYLDVSVYIWIYLGKSGSICINLDLSG